MILLMAGTSEGRELAERLYQLDYDILVTTSSQYGANLLKSEFEQINRGLDGQEIVRLGLETGFKLIIDATHPFALEASKNAQYACEQLNIPYLRLERDSNNQIEDEKIIKVKDYEGAIKLIEPYRRILLTTGSKELRRYRSLFHDGDKEIFVRVLPRRASLEVCWELGVDLDKIIACQGPFSQSFNQTLIRQYRIQVLVSKESGTRGGVDEKIKAALNCDIPIILIERPGMDYSHQVNNIDQVIAFLEKDDRYLPEKK